MLLSTIRQPLTLGALFALALALAIAALTPPGARVLADEKETLIAPFVKEPTAATTKSYDGHVMISVSGKGQAAGSAYSDAFYIFTDDAGNPVTPYHLVDFSLCINQQPVDNYVAIPPYRTDHHYQFKIVLPGHPQHLTFGVCDTYTVDNAGRFTIVGKER
jgi:hypothetical protein